MIYKMLFSLFLTVPLISIIIYMILVFKGKIRRSYTRTPMKKVSLTRKFMLLMSSLAVFICIYQGSYFMLSWIPSDWGTIGLEDGQFTPTREHFSYLITSIFGTTLIIFIDDAVEYRTLGKEIDRIISPHNSYDSLTKRYQEFNTDSFNGNYKHYNFLLHSLEDYSKRK